MGGPWVLLHPPSQISGSASLMSHRGSVLGKAHFLTTSNRFSE